MILSQDIMITITRPPHICEAQNSGLAYEDRELRGTEGAAIV